MNRTDLRALFPGLTSAIYMNTATVNIGSLPAWQAYEHGLEQWMKGALDWAEGGASRGRGARHIVATHRDADSSHSNQHDTLLRFLFVSTTASPSPK